MARAFAELMRFEVERAERVPRTVDTGEVAWDALVRLVRTT